MQLKKTQVTINTNKLVHKLDTRAGKRNIENDRYIALHISRSCEIDVMMIKTLIYFQQQKLLLLFFFPTDGFFFFKSKSGLVIFSFVAVHLTCWSPVNITLLYFRNNFILFRKC